MSALNETYLGHQISFTEERCELYRIQMQNQRDTLSAGMEFYALYYSYGSFNKMMTSLIEDGCDIILRYIDKMAQRLIEHGQYEISTNMIIANEGQYIYESWCDAELALDQICAIGDSKIQDLADLRNERKNNRSRMYGMGFNFNGAIGSAVASGTYNVVSGLLHSGANAIGNSISKANLRKKLDEIYRSEELRESLCDAFTSCIGMIGMTEVKLCNLMPELIALTHEASDNDDLRKDALKDNFERVPVNKKADIAIEILMLDPIDLDTYEWLLKRFKDPSGALEKIAQKLGCCPEYYDRVNAAISDKIETLCSSVNQDMLYLKKDELTSDKLKEIESKYISQLFTILSDYAMDLSQTASVRLSSEAKIRDTIQKNIKRIESDEVATRTYDGIVFDSVEQARLAKSLWENLQAIIMDYESKDSDDLLKVIQEINALLGQTPPQLSNRVQETLDIITKQYQSVDIQERTFSGKLFDSKEECQFSQQTYKTLCEKAPIESLTSKKSLKRAKVLMQEDGLEPYAVHLYGEHLEALESAYYNETINNRNSVLNFLASAVSFYILWLSKPFICNGYKLGLYDYDSPIIVGSAHNVFSVLILVSVGAILLTIIYVLSYLFGKKRKYNNYCELTAFWGVVLCLTLVACGFVGDALDTSFWFKLFSVCCLASGYLLRMRDY